MVWSHLEGRLALESSTKLAKNRPIQKYILVGIRASSSSGVSRFFGHQCSLGSCPLSCYATVPFFLLIQESKEVFKVVLEITPLLDGKILFGEIMIEILICM